MKRTLEEIIKDIKNNSTVRLQDCELLKAYDTAKEVIIDELISNGLGKELANTLYDGIEKPFVGNFSLGMEPEPPYLGGTLQDKLINQRVDQVSNESFGKIAGQTAAQLWDASQLASKVTDEMNTKK